MRTRQIIRAFRCLTLATAVLCSCRSATELPPAPQNADVDWPSLPLQAPMSAAKLAQAGLPAELTELFNRCGGRSEAWLAQLQTGDTSRQEAVLFLLRHMPMRDVLALPLPVFEANLAAALQARREFPWTRTLSAELYHNEVLPSHFLSERREKWRPWLLARLRPQMQDCRTLREAADKVLEVLPALSQAVYDIKRLRPDQSVFETISSGKASCSGLSILLAASFRAVGIPARLAGCPEWPQMDGNHTWVEVHLGDGWHSVEFGAKPGDYDGGWIFSRIVDATNDWRHQVYVSSYRPQGNVIFPMVWDEADASVWAVCVTERYKALAAAKGLKPQGLKMTQLGIEYRQNGHRVARPCRVYNAAGRLILEGLTPSATQDHNDLLLCSAPSGSSVLVQLGEGPEALTQEVQLQKTKGLQRLCLAE